MPSSLLAQFAQRLLLDADAVIPPLEAALEASPESQRETVAVLLDCEAILRQSAPGTPPALDPEAALWGLQVFCWAGQMVFDRHETRTTLPDHLSRQGPSGQHAADHWSVDIVLRFWPDLCNRARQIAGTDPLHETLAGGAAEWPLAAVGMDVDIPTDRLQTVLAAPTLRRIFVDRVVERQDARLAANREVRMILNDDAGAHAETLQLTGWLAASPTLKDSLSQGYRS